MLEHLESRRLLTLPLSGSVIQITGAPYVGTGNDVVELIVSSGVLQLRNGAGTVVDSRSISGVTGINVSTGSGNDFVRMGRADGSLMPGVPITIRGGAGNDTLIGGNNADQIFGEDNDDRLDGRAEGDRIDGGGGFDTADYSYRTRSINVSLTNSSTANDGTNTVDSITPAFYNDKGRDNLVDMEAVLGSANSDYMVGNTSANWFDGGGGNDTMFGGSGIDTLIGGAGTDLGYGDNDADYFFFQDNLGDQFLGGLGTTFAQYDSALDTPAAAATAQTFSSLSLESSTSLLSSTTTNGNGNGGNGNGGNGGQGGGPPSSGEFVDVVLTAEDIQNTDFTFLDKKNVKSIPQYLQLRLKALKPDGSLELTGTSGDDVITISQTGSHVSVSVNGELYDFDSSQLTRIVLTGLGGDDLITADAGVTVPLVIDAGEGNDTVVGGSGNDALFAGDGDDSVSGGDGSDSIDGGAGNDVLAGDGGADSINAGSGDDSVTGGEGDDSLFGEEGADTLLGGGGDDAMDGGADNDSMLGGLGNDVMLGGSGVDSVWGQEGDDNLDGQDGDDILVGEAGQDIIGGGLGRDILIGGTDADHLLGGDADDLLIPGTTSYDTDIDALNWMASEWTRTDRSYSNRIANLNGGGTGSGNNLTYYLRPGEGSTKTVFDDDAADTLTGGADLDYFFVAQKGVVDTLTDRESGENITQL